MSTSEPGKLRRRGRYFYGWNIVAAAFSANLAYAEHYTSVLGLFVKPLQDQFGWSRSAIAVVQTIARVTEAVVSPICGPLVDRYGPRVLMPIGATVVGLAMIGMSRIDALWQFYLLRGAVAALGFTFMGALVTNVAVSNWFVKQRGRALTIARIGNNLSNVIFVPVAVFVIANYGWRSMFVVFAIVTWLAVIVPSIILMRRRPEDMGLLPDGEKALSHPMFNGSNTAGGDVAVVADRTWTRRQLLATSSFWLLALCMGIDSLALQGLNISLAPYIQDLGYPDATLAAVMTFRAIVMIAALPLVAFIAERAGRARWRVLPFVVQALGALIFALPGNQVSLWVAVGVYGLGVAALGVMIEVIWADFFGRPSLGLVRSTAYLAAFGFGAVGPLAMSAVYDLLGTYRPAFIALAGLFFIASVLIAVVRPPHGEEAQPE
jgi:MFS family permease